MKDKLVSVIIPFLNREKETINAIDSVLNQTYSNIEIVLVNDESTESVKKLEKKIKELENVLYIKNKKNLGVAESRNIGMSKAKGEYIAFLDSDDAFVPEKIEIQLKEMIKSKSNVSHTSYTRIFDENDQVIHSGKDTDVQGKDIITRCRIATPTVMIKKSFLDKNKFQFDKEKIYGEDTCFWLTILKDEKILGIDSPLTIVHASLDSAAFNIDKQILGSKTILKFLLNDEYYTNFDKEISLIASLYIDYVNQKQTGKIYKYYQYDNFFQRNLARTKDLIKEKGFFGMIKENFSKLVSLISRR